MAFRVLGLRFNSNADNTSLMGGGNPTRYHSQVIFWVCSNCDGTDLKYCKLLLTDIFLNNRVSSSNCF